MARHMKHSGVDWLGDIPADWTVAKVKQYYKIQTGFTPDTKKEEYYDDANGYDWVNISDIHDGETITETKKKISQLYIDQFSPTQIPAGSLLYSFKLSVGQTAFTVKPLYSNEAIAAFIPSDKINLHFLRYSSFMIVENATVNVYNARILNRERINNAYILFPPLDEQQRIAAFLDDKCGRIDSVIAKTRAAVAEYKKLKQSIITRAVTKGIRTNRPTKDSGIEWLGDIPAHWNVSKIKHNFTVHSGATPKSEVVENWDGDIVWITPADYKTTDKYISQGKRNISELGYRSCGTTLVPSGSIIFSKRAPIGTVAIAAVELCTNQGCLSCVPKAETDSVYYFYVMSALTEQFNLYGTGTTFKEISYDVFRSFKVPVPPIDEQREIAAYLDEKTAAIDSLVAKKNRLVAELERLKKSLIFEYVTGKKEVAQ